MVILSYCLDGKPRQANIYNILHSFISFGGLINMSKLQKNMFKSLLPPRAPSSSGKLAPFGASRKRDYTPTSWKLYFDHAVNIETDNGSFRVYLTKEPEHQDQLRILTLHGGGYSGLSWALFTQEVTNLIKCQVVSMDIRGHGETKTSDPNDLSAETLANDVQAVVSRLWGAISPPLLLIGHSMGGAVAVRAAHHPLLEDCVRGLAVIDVVEGTAMESLASMQSFLRSRPTHFKSIEHAIEWCVRSGQVRNVESAKVSMPSQIVNCKTDLLATHEVEDYTPEEDTSVSRRDPLTSQDCILEEEPDNTEDLGSQEDVCFKVPTSSSAEVADMRYKWRIDLSATERHWSGWFSGLSQAFLTTRAPRLLLLASIDGLDRDLTVGQMQGKFEMKVLPRCGHAVHEDSPYDVAAVLATFALRHRLAYSIDNVRGGQEA